MGKYLTKWDTLKAKFTADTGKAKPQDTVKKALLGTVAKSTGISPAIKDIESALEKKERATLEKALNKFFSVRGTYASFLLKEQAQYKPETDMDIWVAYRELIYGLEQIEKDAAKDAEALQKEKGDGTTAITWLSLEGDMKSTVEASKKHFEAYSALKTKYKISGLLDKSKPAIEWTQKYTKAAARTQAKEAREALEGFQKAGKAHVAQIDTLINEVNQKEKPTADKDKTALKGFKEKLDSYRKAVNDLSVAARVNQQITALKKIEAGG